ncbi:hypothetical protein [Bifidobacterium callimiconis]|uniref:Polysaccharide biosynthesis protein n=1 Tax=Bifidobacterium callimiconis TaxID=2306973 RepID=A0A430FEH8_9BIFI|nr:hypothetical protein [Bifidobacterium callimiconis]RSX51142.1 polysaccharide biosynthesis protein [Bifidobacterium callimiconis]
MAFHVTESSEDSKNGLCSRGRRSWPAKRHTFAFVNLIALTVFMLYMDGTSPGHEDHLDFWGTGIFRLAGCAWVEGTFPTWITGATRGSSSSSPNLIGALIVNRLKFYSIAWLLFSLTSLPLTWLLLEVTPLDIYAVAIVPTALEILTNVTFVPIYASIILGIAKRTFYPVYVQYVASALLSFGVCGGL